MNHLRVAVFASVVLVGCGETSFRSDKHSDEIQDTRKLNQAETVRSELREEDRKVVSDIGSVLAERQSIQEAGSKNRALGNANLLVLEQLEYEAPIVELFRRLDTSAMELFKEAASSVEELALRARLKGRRIELTQDQRERVIGILRNVKQLRVYAGFLDRKERLLRFGDNHKDPSATGHWFDEEPDRIVRLHDEVFNATAEVRSKFIPVAESISDNAEFASLLGSDGREDPGAGRRPWSRSWTSMEDWWKDVLLTNKAIEKVDLFELWLAIRQLDVAVRAIEAEQKLVADFLVSCPEFTSSLASTGPWAQYNELPETFDEALDQLFSIRPDSFGYCLKLIKEIYGGKAVDFAQKAVEYEESYGLVRRASSDSAMAFLKAAEDYSNTTQWQAYVNVYERFSSRPNGTVGRPTENQDLKVPNLRVPDYSRLSASQEEYEDITAPDYTLPTIPIGANERGKDFRRRLEHFGKPKDEPAYVPQIKNDLDVLYLWIGHGFPGFDEEETTKRYELEKRVLEEQE